MHHIFLGIPEAWNWIKLASELGHNLLERRLTEQEPALNQTAFIRMCPSRVYAFLISCLSDSVMNSYQQ